MNPRRQESERRRDSEIAVVALLGVALHLLPAACSRRALESQDAGGSGQVGTDGGIDATVATGGDAATDIRHDALADVATAGEDAPPGVPCGGALTCTGTDVCIQMNLCGGPVQCNDVPDGGQCPPGSTFRENCPNGRAACVPDCSGSTYACKPKPAACNGDVNCNCVGPSFCPVGACAFVRGDAVVCANQ